MLMKTHAAWNYLVRSVSVEQEDHRKNSGHANLQLWMMVVLKEFYHSPEDPATVVYRRVERDGRIIRVDNLAILLRCC